MDFEQIMKLRNGSLSLELLEPEVKVEFLKNTSAFIKMQHVFNQTPEFGQEIWRKLGPFNLEEMIKTKKIMFNPKLKINTNGKTYIG